MTHKSKKTSIEEAVSQMDHIMEMSEQELQETLGDPIRFQACCDLMEISCKLQETASSSFIPDVEKAWSDFTVQNLSIQHKRFSLMVIAGSVAAFAAVVAGIFWWINFSVPSTEPVTVFLANDDNQQIILQTSSGYYAAVGEANDTTFSLLGVQFQNEKAGEEELNYLSYNTQTKDENVEMHTLSTPWGKDIKVVLSDGTEVWLNTKSRLEYPAIFSGSQRVVRLQGEAYFKVAHNKDRPFLIQTDHLQASVLGTEFNICDYSGNNAHVTLINGSVEVAAKDRTDFVKITPGEDARLCEDGSFLIQEIDLSSYIYWKEGYFYFDDMTIEEILINLGRWYNVSVIVQNKNALKYHMRFLADRESGLDYALLLLNQMEKVFITKEDNMLIVK